MTGRFLQCCSVIISPTGYAEIKNRVNFYDLVVSDRIGHVGNNKKSIIYISRDVLTNGAAEAVHILNSIFLQYHADDADHLCGTSLLQRGTLSRTGLK